jgi:multidrug resistance efflux pump
MKSEPLPPIKTPVAQRLRHLRMRLMPPVVFGGALLLVFMLWRDNVAPSMVGQAESLISTVSSHQPGVLAELNVRRFEKVRAGQVLGKVMIANPKMLEAASAVARAEANATLSDPQIFFPERRYTVDDSQLRIDLTRQRADLARSRAELEYAESELRRDEELVKQQILATNLYELAKANRDSLRQEIEELTRLVADGEAAIASLQITNIAPNDFHSGAIALQNAQVQLAEAEYAPIILTAPIDGMVLSVSNNVGESVTPGMPIITIGGMNTTRIVGYLRPPLNIEPRPGMPVEIRTRGFHRDSGSAVITEIGAQFEALPLSLQSSMKLAGIEMGLPVEISLPPNLDIRPGEIVDISIKTD